MESEIDEKLISEFKQKYPGKNAIWRGKATKQFEEWLKKKEKNAEEATEIKTIDKGKAPEIKKKAKPPEINAWINERLTILEQKVDNLQSKQKEIISIIKKIFTLHQL